MHDCRLGYCCWRTGMVRTGMVRCVGSPQRGFKATSAPLQRHNLSGAGSRTPHGGRSKPEPPASARDPIRISEPRGQGPSQIRVTLRLRVEIQAPRVPDGGVGWTWRSRPSESPYPRPLSRVSGSPDMALQSPDQWTSRVGGWAEGCSDACPRQQVRGSDARWRRIGVPGARTKRSPASARDWNIRSNARAAGFEPQASCQCLVRV